MDKSNAKELHNNLEKFVIDTRNNGDDIAENISRVAGDSSEIKQILELLNSIEDIKQKQREQEQQS